MSSYRDSGAVPEAVTLILATTNTSTIRPQAFLPVCHLAAIPEVSKTNFTVCVSSPLQYLDANQLVEWIEVNSLFGADHFVLYMHSGHDQNIQPYVDYYNKVDKLDSIPWNLAAVGIDDPERDVHKFAQLIQENDCFMRNMYQTRYVAFLDIDEFIVPRGQHSSWSDLVSTCEDAAQYQVRCLIFRREWPSDDKVTRDARIAQYNLLTLLKTKVEDRVFPPYHRSKYIVKPLYIKSVMVNHVHKFMNSLSGYENQTCILRPDDALLHHYRNCADWVKQGWKVYTYMHTHKEAIVYRVSQIHRMVTGV